LGVSRRAERSDSLRLARKWALVRPLSGPGYNAEDVLSLFRFLDEVLRLPKPLEIRFRDRLDRYQKRKHMPYITIIERLDRKEGRQDGLVAGLHAAVLGILEARLEDVPSPLAAAIKAIEAPAVLEQLLRHAARAETLRAFEAGLPRD
jgi:hypothetical protein